MEEVAYNTEITDGGEGKRVLQVDVIIPTYRPEKKFSRLLKILFMQTYLIGKTIITNTEKVHWNEKGFEGIGNLEVHHLSREEFGRGATRNGGAHHSRADIVVFMINDAVPANKKLIENLMAVFEKRGPDGEPVIMAYTRQLLDKGCTMAGRFTCSFNYPEDSYTKTKEDLGKMGIKTFFVSNVRYAYDREKFRSQGGFIHKTIFDEDMILAGKTVLQNNYTIAYAAEARVIHSHNYGYAVQFRRSFGLAVFQANHPEASGGTRPEDEGIRLVRQTTRYLVAHRRLRLVPGLIVGSGFKYAGYRLSRCYRSLPIELAAACSMNKEHWE